MPHPSGPPQRGEIYWVDFNPSRGSEQAGHRPALVVSSNVQNRHMNTVLVAAMTTTMRDGPLSVPIPAVGKLTKDGCVLVFQLMTIDKTCLGGYLATLTRNQIDQVNARMKIALGLN